MVEEVFEDALLRPVRYRGYDINAVVDLADGMRRGYLLEEFDFSQVQAVGYTEKRAQDDGMDASDVFLGARLVRLAGAVYGSGPGNLQDLLQTLRTIFTPTVAYAADKANYGYLPLEFELPTTNRVDFPTGYRPLELRCRPARQPTFSLRRDTGAGATKNPAAGGAIGYQAVLECRDPRLYVRPYSDLLFTTAKTATLQNRGDYPAPLDVLLVVPANAALNTSSRVDITVGDSHMRIGVPMSAVQQIIRYSGSLKVVTVESESVEVLRMDLLNFINDSAYPYVPPTGGVVVISPSAISSLASGTRLMWNESFA